MSPTFNAIGLAAADMAISLAFYRRLGLDIPVAADSEPHVETLLPGGIRLMWDSHAALRALDPGFTPLTGGGPSLAFLCADAAEVNRVYADLAATGTTVVSEPWDAEWGQRYAVIRDPDGYQIDIFAWHKS